MTEVIAGDTGGVAVTIGGGGICDLSHKNGHGKDNIERRPNIFDASCPLLEFFVLNLILQYCIDLCYKM